MTTTEAPDVDVIFIRHGEATSNVDTRCYPVEPETIDPVQHGMPKLTRWSDNLMHWGRTTTVLTGSFLPDGLTQASMTCIEQAVKTVPYKLPGVYLLVSSGLTRSIQTLQLFQDAFELEGSADQIRCHDGIAEATNWPQDMPAVQPWGTNFVRYHKLNGGQGPNRGSAVEEETVDLSKTIWIGNGNEEWRNEDGRHAICMRTPTWEEIEERSKDFRIWLRKQCREIAAVHKASGKTGTPRVVICAHGGINMFLLKHWHPKFKKEPDGSLTWAGSMLPNLATIVCRFVSGDDEEADLVEKPHDSFYAKWAPSQYHELGHVPTWEREDGTVLDNKQEHLNFIQRTADEVRDVATRLPECMQVYLSWTGGQDFEASHCRSWHQEHPEQYPADEDCDTYACQQCLSWRRERARAAAQRRAEEEAERREAQDAAQRRAEEEAENGEARDAAQRRAEEEAEHREARAEAS